VTENVFSWGRVCVCSRYFHSRRVSKDMEGGRHGLLGFGCTHGVESRVVRTAVVKQKVRSTAVSRTTADLSVPRKPPKHSSPSGPPKLLLRLQNGSHYSHATPQIILLYIR
jgi:hypothetical protein